MSKPVSESEIFICNSEILVLPPANNLPQLSSDMQCLLFDCTLNAAEIVNLGEQPINWDEWNHEPPVRRVYSIGTDELTIDEDELTIDEDAEEPHKKVRYADN